MRIITKISMVCLLLLATGCASNNRNNDLSTLERANASYDLSDEHVEAIKDRLAIYDPLEPMNRRIYKFNYYFDQYILLPVTKGYETVTPGLLRTGISNFISNLGEITNFINNTLQLKPKGAANSVGRFAVNSTLGILGVFDVATDIGIDEYKEDFGQTLGYYGVGEGPYLVIPFLGPSNLRDVAGYGVDYHVLYNEIDPLDFDDNSERAYVYGALRAIDARSNVPVAYFGSGSPFEYEWLRRFYTDARRIQTGSIRKRFSNNNDN